MNIDWSNAPAHATHWCSGNARIEAGWIYHNGGGEFYSCYADKGLEHIPCFPAWRALRLIPRPAESPKWTGEGLPPVGTVCEYKPYQISSKWSQVEIIAHFRNKAMVAAFIPTGDDGKTVDQAIAECFRPIRTPEQIAAEEREAGVEGIRQAVSKSPNCKAHGVNWDIACAIYDAGYRKQV